MKKTYCKILSMIILLLVTLSILQTNSKAAASFDATCSAGGTVYVGDTITITLKANNAAGNYQVSANNSNVTHTGGNTAEWLENSSTTVTYKATKAGTVTITATATDMADLDNSSNKISKSKPFTITIKEKTSSGNTGSSSNNNNSSNNSNTQKPKTPSFKSTNQKVYTTGDCNLRASYSTSSSATPVKKDTELTLTGTSTEVIDGYTWYRVTYNGATRYIASSLITYNKPKDDEKDDEKKDEDKSSNKNLSSLSIEGIEITPKFDKDTTQYTAKVDGDVEELKIEAKAEDSKAKVNVEGNKSLKEGDNIIKVKVTAEDDTTRTYFITVTKGEGTVTDSGLKLSELNIERVNFEGQFDPDIYTYELSLNTYVENLEITATANQSDATVEISGNENFKTGKNMITILLTSADGSKVATYQIAVNIPEEAVATTNEEPDMLIYIGIGIAIAAVIIAIGVGIYHVRNKNKDDDDDEEYDVTNNMMSRYGAEDEDEKKEDRTSKIKSDVTVDDFLKNDYEEEKEKPRKSKGRHSL